MNEVAKWGGPYNVELVNDVNKVHSYSKESLIAISLGIFNTDLSFAILRDKGAKIFNYEKPGLKLSDALGAQEGLVQMVGKRAEKNLSNKDSLSVILDDIFLKRDFYLRGEERVFAIKSVFAGSRIES